MKTIVAIAPLVCILAIGSVLTPTNARSQSSPANPASEPAGQYEVSDEMLRDFVTEQNRSLPEAYGDSLRWDSVALATGRTLIFNYTFLDPAIDANDPRFAAELPRFQQELQEITLQTICADGQIRRLLNDRITLRVRYYGAKGAILTEVPVDRANCR